MLSMETNILDRAAFSSLDAVMSSSCAPVGVSLSPPDAISCRSQRMTRWCHAGVTLQNVTAIQAAIAANPTDLASRNHYFRLFETPELLSVCARWHGPWCAL